MASNKPAWSYSSLYQEPQLHVFDDEFFNCLKTELPIREADNLRCNLGIGITLVEKAASLYERITIEEKKSCTRRLKTGKAVGNDNFSDSLNHHV